MNEQPPSQQLRLLDERALSYAELGDPFYVNLLGRWLTNDTYPHRQKVSDIVRNLHERERFLPEK